MGNHTEEYFFIYPENFHSFRLMKLESFGVALAGHQLVNAANKSNDEVKNSWAVADYPDMDEPFTVPLNTWGGNSPENAAFEPRAEKTPLDLKFWSKYSSSSFKGPTEEGASMWQADDAVWLAKYRDEMSTEEYATGVKDADGNERYNRKVLT